MRRGTYTRVAKQLEADYGVFTMKKPIRFKPEGSTMNALTNAKLIAEAGYTYKSGIFEFKPQYGDYETSVIFERDNETALHTFKGFSFGYSGEGCRGLEEFSDIFGLGFDKEKIFGRGFIESLPMTGTVTFGLEDFK